MNRTVEKGGLTAVAKVLGLDAFGAMLCLYFPSGGRINIPLIDDLDMVGARTVSPAEIDMKSVHDLPAKSGFDMRFPA